MIKNFLRKKKYYIVEKIEIHGITLIALVITIIVLLILAGISLSMLTGQNGLINEANVSAKKTSLAEVKEAAGLAFTELFMNNYTRNPDLEEIKTKLGKQGYIVEKIAISSESITGISLNPNSITLVPNEEATITINYTGSSSGFNYYAKVNGKYHLMTITSNGVEIAEAESNINISEGKSLTATISPAESGITAEVINENKIKVTGGVNVENAIITIRYGEIISNNCSVAVIVKPTETTVAQGSTLSMSNTNYATIDVIWLDTDNNVILTPNIPNTTSDMMKVTWTFDENSKTWSEDTSEPITNEEWYNYVAGDGKTDTKTSKWANVKMHDGSYFVWIPRYAYRITYYSDEAMTNTIGYFDGYGLWDTQGRIMYKLNATENGIGKNLETVTSNGNKYIVHPAFETDLDNGGWSSDLAGIWVAKYEMSRENSTDGINWTAYGGGGDVQTNVHTSTKTIRAVSVPNVNSWRYTSIGNQYLNGYNYDRAKESHMMKNSEWGAVAYLTQSQYGRNAHEIDINNSSNCITGNGGGSTNASKETGITNAYNTEIGAKASTTGNIYGIYDMSGGGYERVAAYESNGSSMYLSGTNYGKSMMDNAKDEENNYISTKYITKYINPINSIFYGTEIEKPISKIGDALIEVNQRIGSLDKYNCYRMFNDFYCVAYQEMPFFVRGGIYNDGASAGIFCSSCKNGASDLNSGADAFRVCMSI